MPEIILLPKADRRLLNGHPWIFSNEIARTTGDPQPGATVDILNARGQFVGRGHYNPHSLIAVRLMTRQREEIDSVDFFLRRIAAARRYRDSLYPKDTAVRIVYGESDDLSGLVIDRYDHVLSLQFLSKGMDDRRGMIVEALQQLYAPAAIVARNDIGVRSLEGLPQETGVLAGTLPEELIVSENGLQFSIDILGGQKTGGFLDQKENHLALKGRVEGRKVLDLFCYSGGWSTHAAAFGAASVTGVDISASATALACRNAEQNGLADRCTFVTADVFELLKEYQKRGERFGTIVLDPPAFVKSKKKLQEAVKGYLTINRRAMELLEPGGYLFTCSCSYHMERELFLDTLRKASAQAGRTMRLIEVRGQGQDHPVLLNSPETDYLKCVILQAI